MPIVEVIKKNRGNTVKKRMKSDETDVSSQKGKQTEKEWYISWKE